MKIGDKVKHVVTDLDCMIVDICPYTKMIVCAVLSPAYRFFNEIRQPHEPMYQPFECEFTPTEIYYEI